MHRTSRRSARVPHLGPLLGLLLGLLCAAKGAADEPPAFRRHVINADSDFSAATALDVNGDGLLDIVCGAWWYEAPQWQPHKFREVEQIRGRWDDYSNLLLDVDGDGNMDIVSVNYRSQSLYWCRNPGKTDNVSLWDKHIIDTPGPSETGRLVDIDGDGRLDVLPNGTQTFAAWYEVASDASDGVRWLRHDLPAELIAHGIGAGDINGDGRVDVVGPNGWAEAPFDPRSERWQWHAEFQLAKDCGLPILVTDVDGDGDNDLIWGRGHNIGLYWTEQVGPEEMSLTLAAGVVLDDQLLPHIASTKWITHAIDTSWACAHTLMLADIDGDGQADLVTGKRFQGHDGRDPGENDPLSVQWYRFEASTKTWTKHVISEGSACGIDLDSICVDLDGDGDIDILAPARSGLHWLENLRIDGAATGDSQTGDSQTLRSPREPVQLTAEPSNAEPASTGSAVTETPVYTEHHDLSYYLQAAERVPIASALDHGIRRQHILKQLEQVMGPLPNSQHRLPLATHVDEVVETEQYYRLLVRYTADASGGVIDRVPAFLLVPKSVREQPFGSMAAMLCLHQTHFELGKAQLCGFGDQPSLHYAHELANRGYVCLVPDYPGFADYAYDFQKNKYLYPSGSLKAIWNNIRAIDLLESLPCVDRDRIGAIGHSLGGHNALYTAAFEQRIRHVVTSCAFNAFEDYYGGDLKGWSSDRYMPRIASRYQASAAHIPFDFPEVLGALAPRGLFANAPLRDANFAVRGVKTCETSVTPLYELLGAAGDLRFEYPDAEHDFPDAVRAQAYQWLDERLLGK